MVLRLPYLLGGQVLLAQSPQPLWEPRSQECLGKFLDPLIHPGSLVVPFVEVKRRELMSVPGSEFLGRQLEIAEQSEVGVFPFIRRD